MSKRKKTTSNECVTQEPTAAPTVTPPEVEMKISWRWLILGLIIGLLFATVHSCSCCAAEPNQTERVRYARNLEDVHAASCRVFAMNSSGRGAIGTGTVCGLIRGKYYILTNWHVIEGHRNVTLHFFRDGKRFEVKGDVVASWHNDNQPFDFAVITVSERDLAPYNPPIVPLAPRGTRPTVGKTILSAGCSEGRWAMAWKGAIESYHGGYGDNEGNVAIFYPAPKGGQSGSAVVEELDGRLAIVGVLTWRIGDEKSTSEENMRGGCIAVAKLYDAFDGKVRSGILDAVPENATWCLAETEGDPDVVKEEPVIPEPPTAPEDAESVKESPAPEPDMEPTEEKPIIAEQYPPMQTPAFDQKNGVSFEDRHYAIEDPESYKAPVAENRPILAMIEFYSESCIPCGKAKPIVDRLIEEGYAILPVSIDDEKGRGEALKRQVTSVPTFITYESFDNRVTWTEIGRFSGIDHLEERIRQAFSSGNNGGVSDADAVESEEGETYPEPTSREVAPLIEEYENGFFGRRGGNLEEDPSLNDDPNTAPRRDLDPAPTPDRNLFPRIRPDRGGDGFSPSPDATLFQLYRGKVDEIFSWIRTEVKVMIWSALRWAVLIITVFWFAQFWLLCGIKALLKRLPRISFTPSETSGENKSAKKS